MLYINGKQKPVPTIRTDIKKGATVSDFADFFEVSEKIFLEKLEVRLPSETYSEYVGLMEMNQERREKLQKRRNLKPKTEKSEEEVVKSFSKFHEGNEEIRVKELETTIAECNEKIAELQMQIDKNKLEQDEIVNEIEAVKGKLQEYIEQVKIEQSKLTKLRNRKSEKEEEHNQIMHSIEEQSEVLENAETELDSYQKVVITLYDSSIQISKEGIEPLSEEVEGKFLELSDTEPFADYSARNLRKAAEILCAIENIALMGLKYTVEYDKYETVKEIVEEFLKVS